MNPLATAQQLKLELQAVRMLLHPHVAATKQSVAQHWLDTVDPGPNLRQRFAAEFEQAAFCGVMNALNQDPTHPLLHAFGRLAHVTDGTLIPGTRAGHPVADYVYRFAPIEGDARYVLEGRAMGPAPAALEIGVVSKAQTYIGNLSSRELLIDAAGKFSVSLDPDAANGRCNHIQTTSAAHQLLVRDVLSDVARQTPYTLALRCLDNQPARRIEPNDAIAHRCAEGIQSFVQDVLGVTEPAMAMPPNRFPEPAFHRGGQPLVTQAYSAGRYQLNIDEALIFTLTLGSATYAVVPASNRWGGINDILHHTTAFGTGRAVPNPDGSVTFVLSLFDPGVHNWVDPDGLDDGIVIVRWVGFDGSGASMRMPTLTTQHVKRAHLSSALPEGTQYLNKAARMAQLARHEADYTRVFGSS